MSLLSSSLLSAFILFVIFSGAFAITWGGFKLERAVCERYPHARILKVVTAISWSLLLLAIIFCSLHWVTRWTGQ